MKIVMIGAGNVATVLSKKLFAANFTIVQIFNRTIDAAKVLAKEVNAIAINNTSEIFADADVYIISVSDKAIEPLVHTLHLKDKLVLHTAGSVSIHVLEKASNKIGVLYPVQSIRKNMPINTPIPFAIDANSDEVFLQVQSIAQKITNKLVRYNDEQRLKLHVSAIFACNFVNYLYVQSNNFSEKEALDFSLLQPLIEETATRLREYKPADVFTGPAVRGDFATIDKHLQLLEKYPTQLQLYKMLTDLIVKEFYSPKHSTVS